MVEIKGLSKTYQEGSSEVEVLKQVDLKISKGESVAILGVSGSGKSTLLNLIGGLDEPSRGEIFVGDQALHNLSEEGLARFRNEIVGFVFQSHHLLPHCSALENVLIPTLANEFLGNQLEAERRANELLEQVGLKDRVDHLPGELSGGERQRVAVARALINEPVLLLADEPTGALDRQNGEQLMDLLVKLNRENKQTLIMVTHSEVFAKQMNKQLRLEQGSLAES
ncbi:MAG: ABC transporter ATP-binding protein [Verrucomicrobiota bacterium]